MDLCNKRALITGGSRGIGRALAVDLAQQGAHIAINARHQDEAAAATLEEVTALGRQAYFVQADMADASSIPACVTKASEALGGLDILIHNAGGPSPGPIEEVSTQQWNETFAVHVHAAFHLCKAAIPLLKQKDEGVIILVSSVAGIRGCPGAIAYGTAKGAVLHFTRMLARDLADDNIRVNCISPGIIRTRFHENMTDEQKTHNLANRIPLHREGTAQQVAEAVRLLITNDFITGESITIDGGMSMQVVR